MIALRRRVVTICIALIAVGAAVVGGILWLNRPPVGAAEAGLNGDVWVMPAAKVVPFLHSHGVTAQPPGLPYTAVIARAAWTPRTDPPDGSFTLMLGDARGRSGVITAAYGPPVRSVTLGSDSMWDGLLGQHDWLAGDGDLRALGGGYTNYGQFASVPTSWTGDVWVVGYFVDPATETPDGRPEPVRRPDPVLGIAFSTEGHAWWVQQVAR